jgi:uncharacterized protein DUF5916
MLRARSVLLACALAIPASAARAAEEPPSSAAPSSAVPSSAEALPEIRIARAAGPIAVDGELSDAGWNGVPWIETFWETNRGDNSPPPAPTRARLAYDGTFLYAAFECDDPHPESIRAPLSDHDVVPGDTDYAGVILDTRNEGRAALMFLANPRGVEYDAVSSDVSGEDPSLDLYWDAAARITPEGWRLEIRVPFSSLRYDRRGRGNGGGEPVWRVLLYRNYPRDFRYQMFSSRLPKGSNCFICHARPLAGLAGLPPGGHLVAAPYASGRRTDLPEGDVGTPLAAGDMQGEAGLDLKWTPNADTALDATFNPDFSQVESDVAQIAANERFALFFPEKRPFFLEGLDLFSTPIQAVYTRTVTDPAWGARATGQLAGAAYTFLLADDRGGGSVILPGPRGSSFADQDFSSRVLIGRARRDLHWGGAGSFASFLVAAREHQGGGHNRVFGPDFQWRPTEGDSVTGQLLWSDTQTPQRPDLAPEEWDGRRLADHALQLSWDHSTRTWNWYTEYFDYGADFRADTGFLPRVGFRETAFELRRSFYPAHGIFHRVRPLAAVRYGDEPGTGLALRRFVPGVMLDGKWNSYAEFRWKAETVRADQGLFSPKYFTYFVQFSPSRAIGRIQLDGEVGDRVDFVNGRLGRGGNLNLSSNLRPTDHLALELVGGWSRLDVDAGGGNGGGGERRLFTAEVLRLKATYTFTARTFLRLIGQRTRTERDVDLYTVDVDAEEKDFAGSALFAYKLNWQTVLFLGYGDERTLSAVERLEPARRELFLKVSYAVQR